MAPLLWWYWKYYCSCVSVWHGPMLLWTSWRCYALHVCGKGSIATSAICWELKKCRYHIMIKLWRMYWDTKTAFWREILIHFPSFNEWNIFAFRIRWPNSWTKWTLPRLTSSAASSLIWASLLVTLSWTLWRLSWGIAVSWKLSGLDNRATLWDWRLVNFSSGRRDMRL